MTWETGDVIMWCYRREVIPVRVVEDGDALVTWVAPGTPVLRVVPVDGRDLRDRPPLERFTTAKHFVVVPWFGAGVLRLAHSGAAHSSWLFRRSDGSGDFWGWYGNLESPLRRSEIGVHTVDHVLDVWLDADGNVGWKDEDELEAALTVGRFSEEEGAEIRAEGQRVFDAMTRRDPPYDGAWLDWRPDPSWEVPQLPDEWAAIAGEPARELFPETS